MCPLNDKVVIVTSGNSGIGRTAALSFAEQGAKVIITARRAAPLEETAAAHPNISGLVADATAPDDAAGTIAKAVDTWGRLDVLVNNAGAGPTSSGLPPPPTLTSCASSARTMSSTMAQRRSRP